MRFPLWVHRSASPSSLTAVLRLLYHLVCLWGREKGEREKEEREKKGEREKEEREKRERVKGEREKG